MGNFIIPTDEQTYLSEGYATNEVILGGIPKRAVDHLDCLHLIVARLGGLRGRGQQPTYVHMEGQADIWPGFQATH